jgi:hypothetical protein
MRRCWLQTPPLWDSVDVCGLLVLGIWVVWMVTSAVVRSVFWPARTCLRLETPSRVSFWMTFHGCFVELMSMMGANVEIY